MKNDELRYLVSLFMTDIDVNTIHQLSTNDIATLITSASTIAWDVVLQNAIIAENAEVVDLIVRNSNVSSHPDYETIATLSFTMANEDAREACIRLFYVPNVNIGGRTLSLPLFLPLSAILTCERISLLSLRDAFLLMITTGDACQLIRHALRDGRYLMNEIEDIVVSIRDSSPHVMDAWNMVCLERDLFMTPPRTHTISTPNAPLRSRDSENQENSWAIPL